MPNFARFTVLIAALCALAAPAPGRAAPAAFDASPTRAASRPSDSSLDPNLAAYVLGPGDMLRISVFGEDALAGQFGVPLTARYPSR